MDDKVTLDEAIELIDDNIDPLPEESVEVLMSGGRVLAERVNAWVDMPGADISTLDGYATRSTDIAGASESSPAALAVAGSSTFNNPFDSALPAQSCVKIITGATVSEDMDVVVPREAVTEKEGEILVSKAFASEHGIRRRAEEFRVGETLADAGLALTPGAISLLIAAGWSEVKAARMLRARVLAVGDELKGPGQMVSPGQIYPSSAALVVSWLRMIGVTDVRLTLVADDPFDILEAMPEPRVADMVVTVGGSGESDQDVVMEALAEREVEMIFRGLKATPGHYTSLAMLENMPILCLPGGPGAAEMMFQFLVRRATAALMGLERRSLTRVKAVMMEQVKGRSDLERLVRVSLKPGAANLEARLMPPNKIHLEIARADGMIKVPPGGTYAAGQEVEVTLTRY